LKAALTFLEGKTPVANGSSYNGAADIPAMQSEVITVTADNVKAVLIDSGYYPASDFTGL
jgi:putative multiple sugar transport system substrate-binding protein